MRILALDVGDKRIGMAVSDPTHTIAGALPTLDREKNNVPEKVRILIEQYGIQKIIVGLPLRTDGTPGDQVRKVRKFAQNLQEEIQIPIIEWDERYTSVQAEKAMISMDLHRDQRKSAIDQVAALLILQSYLDHIKTGKSS
jgi:putative Holliday junction resolvase